MVEFFEKIGSDPAVMKWVGAVVIAALGFAGLRMRNGIPKLRPRLPKQLRRLSFPITAGGRRLMIEVTREGGKIRPL